jgi:rhodanese-related sulfurtransferase
VEAEGWRFVAFVPLVPLFPFNLLNYALGLTQIPLTQYVLASLVCMAPGTLAYAWLGYAGREALADNRSAINYALIALALLAAVALLPRLIRRLRGDRELKWIEAELLANWLNDGANVVLIDVRGPDEFTGPLGHLPHALNLPVGTLPDRLTEIKMFEEQPIVVVCRTHKRSAKAASILQEAGFQGVRVLRGGMERWDGRQAD